MKVAYCQAHGGSHLLRSLRREAGASGIEVRKWRGGSLAGADAFLLRDPRDLLVSLYRYWLRRETGLPTRLLRKHGSNDSALFALATAEDGKFKSTFLQVTENLAHELEATQVPVLRFEDVVSGKNVDALFDQLGLALRPDEAAEIYEGAFGRSKTFTGRLSDHREWFGPKCRRLWASQGSLLKRLGCS